MIVGSLLDLGVNKNYFIKELAKLGLKNYKIELKKINKRGVRAVRFIVYAKKENKTRGIDDINKIINQSSLKPAVKILSKKIFLNLAKAEAKAHKTPINKVHFHEVGSVDSIIDIVASSILINKLKPQKIRAFIVIGTVIFPAAKELLKGIPLSIIKINKELVTPTGAAILKTAADEFARNEIDIRINKKGRGAGKRDLKIPNVLEAAIF